MSKVKSHCSSCKDVFNSFLDIGAVYDGYFDIPCVRARDVVPGKLISFSKALKTSDYDQFVHFYKHDAGFERVWRSPKRYLPVLRRFAGVITPDFSLYRDMPIADQIYNTRRGKRLGSWWQYNGLTVLPNVRFSNERSYSFCCDGVSIGSTICIGSHGCLRAIEDRSYFKRGLEFVVFRLKPKRIIVYGATPSDVFSVCYEQEIEIVQFDSEIRLVHKAGVA